MDSEQIDHAIARIAGEIYADIPRVDDIVILGIPKRGVPLARRIAAAVGALDSRFHPEAATGQLDITMYRDDLRKHPTRAIGVTEAPAIDGKVVVLVDDVLATGRTIRAALDALSDLGRPHMVRLAVLVERRMRQLPISPDYVGTYLATDETERVSVHLLETDGADNVIVAPLVAPLVTMAAPNVERG